MVFFWKGKVICTELLCLDCMSRRGVLFHLLSSHGCNILFHISEKITLGSVLYQYITTEHSAMLLMLEHKVKSPIKTILLSDFQHNSTIFLQQQSLLVSVLQP